MAKKTTKTGSSIVKALETKSALILGSFACMQDMKKKLLK